MGEEAQRGSFTQHDTGIAAPTISRKRARTSTNGSIWACPFYKWDPVQYLACRDHTLSRIGDVAQHINRRHLQPTHCPTCGDIFEGNDGDSKQKEHVRQRACVEREFWHAGATPDQVVQMKRKPELDLPSGTAEEKQWYGKYTILFGEKATLPASPYRSFLEGDNAKQLCDLLDSFSDGGHLFVAAQCIDPNDADLPNKFVQLFAYLKRHALEPPQMGQIWGVAPAPARPEGSDRSVLPGSPNQGQPPQWPSVGAYHHTNDVMFVAGSGAGSGARDEQDPVVWFTNSTP
ncbi:hypothetical protein B0T16DRAFT_411813 [Cercophora newfieldiana]|uniref:Uncharacterized protein n=1 Tax=Cercophora newfieldiana TaxID=92897 RepID=A0AA40CNS3_9PEZI|nr:hypothetical protein B0T16DRAFT_411813 [Cercophora newfieldiana]